MGAATFLVMWNPLIADGAAFWRSWWGLPGALAVLAVVNVLPINVLARFPTNAALLTLSLRVQRRAMKIALEDLLQGFDLALAGGHNDSPPSGLYAAPAGGHNDSPPSDLYARLHHGFASTWQSRIPFMITGRYLVLLGAVMAFVPLFINLGVGSCVTLYTLCVLYWILTIVCTDVAHMAQSNQQIDAIVALYRRARTEIRAMLVRERCLSTPGDGKEGVLKLLREHERLLASFCDVEGARASFLGFTASFGVLRTLVVTVFTVSLGFWSVLHGSGVFFTVESICPG